MPIYEYACENCGKTTDALRKMDDADAPLACEHCGSTKTQRAHSVPLAVNSTGSSRSASLPMSSGGGGGGHCCGGGCRH